METETISSSVEMETETKITPPSGEPYENKTGQVGATLVWKDLYLYPPKNRKKILLDNVSGKINGGLWAIMGPSGSGKTSLLNALACRLDRGMKVTGNMMLNGHDYDRGDVKAVGGYVMQDDVLWSFLTVYESLMYTARLRMPPGSDHKSAVEDAMEKMGLTHARDVIVGSPMKKGISGGERKRLCVAIELLNNPSLLFLDEPTSGLDSVSALNLCLRLKMLADSGACTIVCTIHQPQAKIFALFDQLVLLSKGSTVYNGPAKNAIRHFASLGYPMPAHENPADFLMDVVVQTVPLGKQSPDYDKIKYQDHVGSDDLTLGSDRPDVGERDTIGWWGKFCILFERSFKQQTRNYWMLLIQIIQAIIMGILTGTAFLQFGDDQTSITKRNALLFFTCINQGTFASFIVINSFPGERMVVLRERAAGTYPVSAYFISKWIAESLAQLFIPFLFGLEVYWLVGLQVNALKFFGFLMFMILCNWAAIALATCIACYARTTDLAVTILPFIFELCRLFGGYYLAPISLPGYFSWLDALSYVKYAYVGISNVELKGLIYNCTTAQLTVVNGTPTCPVTHGEQTMASLGLDYLSWTGCVAVLASYILGFNIFSYIGLRFIKW